ncbi:thiol-disulfide oxidoreductase DCC family protein [Sediminibacillus halophilus]|uniref:Predicted thiol-disulfide oxidoreductase YuxK, DCC family n=1 Tax=Sediminibacillus halophilus TaxID=482461 RepID=A0A1G9QN98_9BACI|nr:DUF393 domain-containing protein [Sediminibacillus halophilus]SDM12370.1 Predicted thiol-disulfide oxidoreductase YuxK, DCC family [Sediminibacillus halophilus]
MERKSIVLYDGDCYLCRQTKQTIKLLDWFGSFRWLSLQEYEKRQSVTSKQREAIRGEIHLVKPDGKISTGYQAVRFMLARCPLTAPLGILMYLPYAEVIGDPLYRLIAKNRYRIFKNKCTNGVCKLPQ